MQKTTLWKIVAAQAALVVILAIVVGALVLRKGDDGDGTPASKAGKGNPGRPSGRSGWATSRPTGGGPGKPKDTGSASSIPVKVARVVRRSIDASLWDSTWLGAETHVDVLTKSAGEIVKLNVEEGDTVKEGDVLAEIESDKPQVECDKAKVEVANAKIALNNAEVSLEKAQISYNSCKLLYERYLRMLQQRVISSEEHDDRKLNCDTAKAEVDKAKLDLEAAKLKLSTEELELATAKLNLHYTKICSPIAGVVTARGVERGQVVNTNYAAFSVADYDPIIAVISVPETDLGKIRIAGPVRVEAESVPGKELSGKVSLISPVAETGKVKVEVEIPNANGTALRPGMYVTVHLVTETRENALVIPKRALVIESDANEVFVAEDIIVAKIPAGKANDVKVDAAVTIAQTIESKSGDDDAKEKTGAEAGAEPKEDEQKKEPQPQQVTVQGKVANVLAPIEGEETTEVTVALPDHHGLKKDTAAKIHFGVGESGEGLDVDVDALEPKTRAVKRKVELGLSERNNIEVTSGVGENERVVTAGNEELKNGSDLLVMEEETLEGETKQKIASAEKPKGGRGGWRGGAMSEDFLARMKERVLANPQVKAEYEKRVKSDPTMEKDPKKFFAFMSEMRERGLIKRRRRPRPE